MKSLSFAFGLGLFLPCVTAFSPGGRWASPFRNGYASQIERATTVDAAATPFTVAGPSTELLELFNEQVTKEFAASHLYLSASIWFEARDWEGMAAYMRGESEDERTHALSFIDFANKRSIPLELQTLEAPLSNWDSPEQVWSDVLQAEKTNTQSLLRVAEAANKCQDFAVLAFLNPFHMEQVESEAKIGNIVTKVNDENKTPGLLRQLDHELGLEASARP